MLGVSFLLCALLLAGLPPLSGFLAKFAMLAPMLEAPSRAGTMTLFTLVIVSGFCTVLALCRAGIQIFWADADRHFPHARVTEVSAIVFLLGHLGRASCRERGGQYVSIPVGGGSLKKKK